MLPISITSGRTGRPIRCCNATLQARNDALEVDVIDLKSGYEAIEERARGELGMVKRNEVFFQFVEGAVPTRH